MPIKIHGKEYVTVAERVHAFREMHPSGFIHTQLVSADDQTVIMRAEVGHCVDAIPECSLAYEIIGVGHAEERRGSSQINTTSALENCETSAIGRALAAAGFGVEAQYASGDEVKQAIHQQNASKPPGEQVFVQGTYKDETVEWVWPQDPAYIDRISAYSDNPLGKACADYIAEHAAEHAEKMAEIKARKAAKAAEKTA